MDQIVFAMTVALAITAFAYALWIMITIPGRNRDRGPSRN
jgi:hypothetical protein